MASAVARIRAPMTRTSRIRAAMIRAVRTRSGIARAAAARTLLVPALLLPVMLAGFLCSCTVEHRFPSDSAAPPAEPLAQVDTLVILTEDLGSLESDPYAVEDAQLAGEALYLRTLVSGGCVEHAYQLYVYRYFAESFPVQTWAYLVHDDADDPCDSIYEEELQFDIHPVIELYQQTYPGSLDPIILHIYSSEDRVPGEWITVTYTPASVSDVPEG